METDTSLARERHEAPPARKSLVFADDNRSLLEAMGHLLDAGKYELRAANDGLEALCLVAERPPDFLFVDKACGGLDGFQLCALLKARAEYAGLQVVLMCDGADLDDQVKARVLGARGILRKPFGRAELLAFLNGEQCDDAA